MEPGPASYFPRWESRLVQNTDATAHADQASPQVLNSSHFVDGLRRVSYPPMVPSRLSATLDGALR